jgi:hypothetical protein
MKAAAINWPVVATCGVLTAFCGVLAFAPVPSDTVTVADSAASSAAPVAEPAIAQTVGRHACGDAIKMQLRDPDSYQFVDLTLDPNNASQGVQTFRAKNGFGGYAVGQATCTRESEGTRAVLLTAD